MKCNGYQKYLHSHCEEDIVRPFSDEAISKNEIASCFASLRVYDPIGSETLAVAMTAFHNYDTVAMTVVAQA